MSNWKDELQRLELPENLQHRGKAGMEQVENERKKRKPFFLKASGLVAAILLCVSGWFIFKEDTIKTTQPNETSVREITKNGDTIEIPPLQIPENADTMDMIGLVVYKGQIYTQSDVRYEGDDIYALKGMKLGDTKNTLDEWSKKEEFEKELASNIGESSIYEVEGYNTDFRIMSYQEWNGKEQAEIFERLNGLSMTTGGDVFDAFHMVGNVAAAKWQTFNDWDRATSNFTQMADVAIIEKFVEQLGKAIPLIREVDHEPISNQMNQNDFKALTITLKDDMSMTFKLFKGGYVYYGGMDIYFKVEQETFDELWQEL